jgi:BirA family biotin operon repressor/biotin-[acetyl-CoA-carboxylase] ligase
MNPLVIQFLKRTTDYVSGEEISRHLKLSRASIWKYIEEMRRDGYEIEAVPHRGYRLISCPNKLSHQEVLHGLNTKIIGKEYHYHDSVLSTMDLAFQLGMKNAKDGTVVCAETQTKGRGRMGRGWVSPKGKGIYFSVILRPDMPPSQAPKFTLLAGVALSHAVKNITGIVPKLKWPNDLMINNKKLAGILTELNSDMDCVKFIVIGVGINVNTPSSQLPSTAVSLKNETKKEINRVLLLQEIFRQFEKYYFQVREQGFDAVIKECKEISATLGTRIKLVDAGQEVEGQAIDIDNQGALIIRSDAGIAIKRMTGDVLHVS